MARPLALVPVLLLGAALAGCGSSDARLKQLTVGITRDSVLKVMVPQNPDRIDRYLANSQSIEALYFARPGVDSGSTPDRQMSPVVLVDGLLMAWGWEQWDSVATANRIVVAK